MNNLFGFGIAIGMHRNLQRLYRGWTRLYRAWLPAGTLFGSFNLSRIAVRQIFVGRKSLYYKTLYL